MGKSGSSLFALAAASSLQNLGAATSFVTLERAAVSELGRLGFEVSVGAIVQRKLAPQGQEVGFLFGSTQHPWIQHYQEAGLGANCPISGSARQAASHPLGWAEIRSKPLGKLEQRIFDHLSDFQLRDGLIVGIESVGRTMVFVSSAAREVVLDDPITRNLAHLISVNYGVLALAHWREEHEMPRSERPLLRPRQLDCLRWVLEGKSSSVIAEILGVAPKTVDEHLENACATLGVRTRVQACAEALRLGLISL